MESDSEEEDIFKKDNLNCAILNDSFLVSPGRSDKDDSSSKESSVVKNNINTMDNDTSLLAHFSNMDLKYSPKEDIKNAKLRSSECISKKIKENETRNVLMPHTNDKTEDNQFATPQVRSFSVQRRPRELCSTQSLKDKSAIVNEFRTQKVLFQTPMAISRAPILQNDSISLSLCDTINDCETPLTAGETSQTNKDNNNSPKSKKSLDNAFMEAGKDHKNDNYKKLSSAVKGNTTININQGSYVLIQKLGCGGSSSVYLAKRKDDGKEFALKVSTKLYTHLRYTYVHTYKAENTSIKTLLMRMYSFFEFISNKSII